MLEMRNKPLVEEKYNHLSQLQSLNLIKMDIKVSGSEVRLSWMSDENWYLN